MRKKLLESLLKDTEQQLNSALYENEQLLEKLKKAEETSAENVSDFSEQSTEIQSLKEEINTLNTEYQSKIAEKDAVIAEYEEKINQLNAIINDLKGEQFDTQKYANDLKARLDALSAQNDSLDNTPAPSMPLPPPPKIKKIESVQETDPQLFDYATTVISKAITASAEIKGKLETSGDKNTGELIALLTGKTEMLKSDVLQCLISDEENETKQQKMDTTLAETIDYFGGILGQLDK